MSMLRGTESRSYGLADGDGGDGGATVDDGELVRDEIRSGVAV